MIQSTLDIVHICNMHVEADYSHTNVEDNTVSRNKPGQSYVAMCSNVPPGNTTINRIVNIYTELSVVIELKDT